MCLVPFFGCVGYEVMYILMKGGKVDKENQAGFEEVVREYQHDQERTEGRLLLKTKIELTRPGSAKISVFTKPEKGASTFVDMMAKLVDKKEVL